MNINTRNLSFVNFNNEEMQWVKFNNVTVYEAWRELISGGVPPIIIKKSKGASLIDYKIHGDSIQDGIPTPQAPIEIESVGIKTKNLVDISDTIISGNNSWTAKDMGDYELPAGTYTLSARYKQIGINKSNISISVRKYGSISPKYGEVISSDESGYIVNTFTIPEDSKGCRLYFYSNITDNVLDTSCEFYDIMLNAGSTATEYEPYGYKIPITTKGFNVIDKSKSVNNGIRNEIPTTLWASAFDNTYVKTVFEPGKTYTISYDMECVEALPEGTTVSSDKSVGLNWVSRQISMPNILSSFLLQKGSKYHFSKKFTIPEGFLGATDAQMSVYSNYAKYADGSTAHAIAILKNLMVVEGSEEQEYEPYVEPFTTNIYMNEPLRKIDPYKEEIDDPLSPTSANDYTDYIDFKNKKIYRSVVEKTFDGSDDEEWTINTDISVKRFSIHLPDALDGHKLGSLSDKFVWVSSNKENNSFVLSNGSNSLYVRYDAITNIDDWKTYLSNNPFKVVYPLENRVIQDIDLPNIPTIKGTTIIQIDSETNSSHMDVVYYGKGKLSTLNETDNEVLNYIIATDTETLLNITSTEINEELDKIIGGIYGF